MQSGSCCPHSQTCSDQMSRDQLPFPPPGARRPRVLMYLTTTTTNRLMYDHITWNTMSRCFPILHSRRTCGVALVMRSVGQWRLCSRRCHILGRRRLGSVRTCAIAPSEEGPPAARFNPILSSLLSWTLGWPYRIDKNGWP